MSTTENKELNLLKETFKHLELTYKQWQDYDKERISDIYQFLQEKYSVEFIRNAYTLIKAEYAILQERNLMELIQRVQLQFHNEIDQETAGNILSILIFGTTDITEDDLISQQIRMTHGLGNNSEMGSEVENAMGKFGYDIGNPIPLQGIDKINDYFVKLKLNTGESITKNRIGSFKAENLPYPVDKYEILNIKKEVVAHLFVYAYHGSNSLKVPEGFIFES